MNPSEYPAAVAYVLNLIAAVVVSFDVLTPGVAQAVSTAVVALTSLVVVFLTRPIAVPVATGAFQTFIVAVAAFGFHLRDEQIAAVVGIFGLVVAIVTHQLVIPAVAARKGTTQAAVEAVRARR